MQSRSVTEAGTTRFDSRANQRAFLIGTHAADFPSGPAAYGLHKQAGHMKATGRIASPQKSTCPSGASTYESMLRVGMRKFFLQQYRHYSFAPTHWHSSAHHVLAVVQRTLPARPRLTDAVEKVSKMKLWN